MDETENMHDMDDFDPSEFEVDDDREDPTLSLLK